MNASLIERLILVNQVAQAVHPIDELLSEVASSDENSRLAWFDALASAVSQAHPQPTDFVRAIADAGLRPTFTQCTLLSSKPLGLALATMRGLPMSEMQRSFRLLVSVLAIADSRRRLLCPPGCAHWWHQDLRDPDVVRRIASYEDSASPTSGQMASLDYFVYADLSRPLTPAERTTLFSALDASVPGSGCVGPQRNPNDEIYFTVDAASADAAHARADNYVRRILAEANLQVDYTIEVRAAPQRRPGPV